MGNAPMRDRTDPLRPGDPAAKHDYLAHVRVRHHELDPLGHVNNAAYLNYLEQAAIDHAAAAGFPADHLRDTYGALFIARRHELDYLRPALAANRLLVATWAVSFGGAQALRAYEITRLPPDDPAADPPRDALLPPDAIPANRGEILVRARTLWAFVDVQTGRPRRLPPELRDAFLQPNARV